MSAITSGHEAKGLKQRSLPIPAGTSSATSYVVRAARVSEFGPVTCRLASKTIMAAFAVGTRRRRVAATVTAAVCMCMAAVCLFDDGSNATNTSDLAVSSSSLLHARVSRNLQSIVGKAVAPEEQSPFFVPSQEDLSYCMSNNDVPARGDDYVPGGNKFVKDVQDHGRRVYSLQYDDFIPRHSRQCKTLQEMTDAIKNGRRVWDSRLRPDQMSSTERQIQHSTFVPDQCDLLAMSPHKTCEALSEFGHVAFHGDSMSRQLRAGMLMALTNDLILGGMIASRNPSPDELQLRCKCDGQFSESENCRLEQNEYNIQAPQSYMTGICPNIDIEQMAKLYHIGHIYGSQKDKGIYGNAEVACQEDASYKGLLVIVNGGLHYSVNAQKTYDQHIRPLLDAVKTCAALGKVTLLWNSLGLQAQVLDSKFPHQAKSNVMAFNADMEDILRRNGVENVVMIDWVNFTDEAQSSDGVHHLSQANYFKAQYLLRIAKQAKAENFALRLISDDSGTETAIAAIA